MNSPSTQAETLGNMANARLRQAFYTLADLAEMTGAKPRSIQCWADAGALKPDNALHGGTGTHRTYAADEAAVACALALGYARFGFGIGMLIKIAAALRELNDVQNGGLVSLIFPDDRVKARWGFDPRDVDAHGDVMCFVIRKTA